MEATFFPTHLPEPRFGKRRLQVRKAQGLGLGQTRTLDRVPCVRTKGAPSQLRENFTVGIMWAGSPGDVHDGKIVAECMNDSLCHSQSLCFWAESPSHFPHTPLCFGPQSQNDSDNDILSHMFWASHSRPTSSFPGHAGNQTTCELLGNLNHSQIATLTWS